MELTDSKTTIMLPLEHWLALKLFLKYDILIIYSKNVQIVEACPLPPPQLLYDEWQQSLFGLFQHPLVETATLKVATKWTSQSVFTL